MHVRKHGCICVRMSVCLSVCLSGWLLALVGGYLFVNFCVCLFFRVFRVCVSIWFCGGVCVCGGLCLCSFWCSFVCLCVWSCVCPFVRVAVRWVVYLVGCLDVCLLVLVLGCL